MMVRLLARHAGQDPAKLNEEAVRAFFLHLVRDRQDSSQSIRQARAALTAFFVEMLGRTDWSVFASVKTKDPVKLPLFLSREEVRKVLGHVREMRFAVPLRLIYLCGLRLSECLHVEMKDIQRGGMRLHVREGKGGKDRMVPLPEAALKDLEQWWRWHRHPRLLVGSVAASRLPHPCGAAPASQSVSAAPSGFGSGDGPLVEGHAAARQGGARTSATGADAHGGASHECSPIQAPAR